MLLQLAATVGETSAADVTALNLEHQCECGEPFGSWWGLRQHRRSCGAAQEEFEENDQGGEDHKVEDVLDVRGPPGKRSWRVKFYGKDDDDEDLWPDRSDRNDRSAGDGRTLTYRGRTWCGWQEEENLAEGTIPLQQKFWRDHKDLDRRECIEVEWENRCEFCNKTYKSVGALKSHRDGGKKKKRCWKRPKQRSYKNTEVDRIVKASKRAALLKDLPQCQLEGVSLKHKMQLEYLGHMLQGDGGCDVDVARRTAMARRSFNELYWMWGETQLPLQLKLRIFDSNILTRVIWGSEGWLLTDAVIHQLNGWCSRCLSRITGKTPREEASARTQTMCLPGRIRYRRMKWLGHLLRNDPGDLTRQLLLRYAEVEARGMISVEGSILMDAPAYNTKDQLVALAGGNGSEKEREEARKTWREWSMRHLSDGDRARMKKSSTPSDIKAREIKANTPEETAKVLRDTEHDWRLYSDGGCDGNGAKGFWGDSEWE